MKKMRIALLFCIITYSVSAQQWSGDNNLTSTIYRNGSIGVNGLYLGRYGSSLAGDSNPYTISSYDNEVHDLILYGSSTATLHFRLLDGDLKLGPNTSSNAILYNSGSAFFNGSVGIGTLSPYSNSKFHVKASSDSPWTVLAESSGNSGVIGMSHNGSAGQISVSYLGSGSFSPLQFRTSNLERMTILANGNIGIGTPSPTGRLDINYPGGQLRLSGGTVAGGVWTNTTDVLYLADWNTASKGISINMTTGDVKVGSEDGVVTGYGAKLHLLGNSSNGDALWMSRYNNGDNKSELRVNIGDDFGQQEDMFTVGTHHWNGGEWKPHLSVHASGRVGIGTTNPDAKLAVKGTVHAEEVKVDLQVPGPDYVFEPTYQLPTLTEIENYIKANKHLPEVPSAKEMETNGINLSEMNMLLLKKVEELTLYLIESEKRNAEYEKRLKSIELKLSENQNK